LKFLRPIRHVLNSQIRARQHVAEGAAAGSIDVAGVARGWLTLAALFVATGPPIVVFAVFPDATGLKVLRSTDGGATWR
jgi:hypothetical protein